MGIMIVGGIKALILLDIGSHPWVNKVELGRIKIELIKGADGFAI